MIKKMLMILMLVLVVGNCTRTITGPTEVIVCTTTIHHHHSHKDRGHGKSEKNSRKSTHTTCESQSGGTAEARDHGEVPQSQHLRIHGTH